MKTIMLKFLALLGIVKVKRCNGGGVNKPHLAAVSNFYRRTDSEDGLQGACKDCGKKYNTYAKSKRKIGGTRVHTEPQKLDESILGNDDYLLGIVEEPVARENPEVQTLFKTARKRKNYDNMSLRELHKENLEDMRKRVPKWNRKARPILKEKDPIGYYFAGVGYYKRTANVEKMVGLFNRVYGMSFTANDWSVATRIDLKGRTSVGWKKALAFMEAVKEYVELNKN